MNESWKGSLQGVVGRPDCTAEKVRETAASVVLSMLESTAGRAEKLVSIVLEKTNSVTRQEPPSAQVTETKNPNQRVTYPPLFNRQRELIESINRSLDGIEDIMSRCEL